MRASRAFPRVAFVGSTSLWFKGLHASSTTLVALAQKQIHTQIGSPSTSGNGLHDSKRYPHTYPATPVDINQWGQGSGPNSSRCALRSSSAEARRGGSPSRPRAGPRTSRKCRRPTRRLTGRSIWVWVKIKPPGDRRFWSIFPFARVPLGYPFLTHSHLTT